MSANRIFHGAPLWRELGESGRSNLSFPVFIGSELRDVRAPGGGDPARLLDVRLVVNAGDRERLVA
jgi:hypothetical protein